MPARQESWSRGLAHPEQREERLPCAGAHGTDAQPTETKGVFPILRGETATVTEDNMILLARDIANKIEAELEYPGQIKVNVIRETKAVEFAK